MYEACWGFAIAFSLGRTSKLKQILSTASNSRKESKFPCDFHVFSTCVLKIKYLNFFMEILNLDITNIYGYRPGGILLRSILLFHLCPCKVCLLASAKYFIQCLLSDCNAFCLEKKNMFIPLDKLSLVFVILSSVSLVSLFWEKTQLSFDTSLLHYFSSPVVICSLVFSLGS